MSKYMYKNNYYLSSGINVVQSEYAGNISYISSINRNGDGSRQNPYASLPNVSAQNKTIYYANILANGIYRNLSLNLQPEAYSFIHVVTFGSNMLSTKCDLTINSPNTNRDGRFFLNFKDIQFNSIYVRNNLTNTGSFSFYKCTMHNAPIGGYTTNFLVSKSIVYFPNNTMYYQDKGQNSYISTDIINVINSLALYENCNVTLDTQARLTTYLNPYAAFNDCKFKIGNEAGWTTLNGTTEAEYRADFVARCQAQGWTVPTGSEFGDTNMPMYRWIFAGNSSKNGVPLLNGIIHNFEKRRFVTFGYETKRAGIVVSSNQAAINSINPGTPGEALELVDNAITFQTSQDITDRVVGKKQSNIMWLGGKVKLTALDVVHNMPLYFGVMVDSESVIDFTMISPTGVQDGELYIVRSADKQYAAITYNGASYNTSLANNAQVFKGVSGQTGFTITSGNPVIYRITDFVQHQTIGMRIVNKLPADIIRSGNLNADYWYFVEHDTDQGNTTDYITYNGNNYYSGSSFLVQAGVTNFTIAGNIHLRRCWHKDFNWETMQPTDVDYNFWLNEQKPKWCKIVLGDTPRCFMTANNNRQNEMQTDENGEYLTTGTPAFYRMENGDGGITIPSYPVQGAYMQLRLVITTQNPM